MVIAGTVVDDAELARFCTENRIRRLQLFGSVLHGRAHADSDVDLLVEFAPDARVGLIRLAAMERELSTLLGRTVDLRSPADLSRHFRDQVVREARNLHEDG